MRFLAALPANVYLYFFAIDLVITRTCIHTHIHVDFGLLFGLLCSRDFCYSQRVGKVIDIFPRQIVDEATFRINKELRSAYQVRGYLEGARSAGGSGDGTCGGRWLIEKRPEGRR